MEEDDLMDVNRNNRADHLATWYRDTFPASKQSRKETNHEESSKISVSISGVRLVSQMGASLPFHING